MSCEDHPRPRVVLPDDVLVRVKAASINPIDYKTKEGYGKMVMNFIRRKLKVRGNATFLLLIMILFKPHNAVRFWLFREPDTRNWKSWILGYL